MFKIWDPTNFRRTFGGAALILAPILFAIQEITFPVGDGASGTETIAAAARSHDLLLADIYIGIASAILFIPAVYALLHVTRRRGVVLGHVAAVLTITGLALAHLVLAGLQLMIWAMASPGVDRQAMASFLNSTMQSPAGLPVFMGNYLFALGFIVFGIAVWRSRFGYRWAGPVVVLGIVIDILGGSAGLPDQLVSVVSDVLFCTALAAIGLRVLLIADAEWELGTEPAESLRSAVAASPGM